MGFLATRAIKRRKRDPPLPCHPAMHFCALHNLNPDACAAPT